MKALVIDSATTVLSIAAKNDTKYAEVSLDVGMRQSEKLLPLIEYVLQQVDLTLPMLEFAVTTKGPGSFTGLRLSFAALKALQLTINCPIYGIPTLDVYSYPYRNWNGAVLSGMDAKKNRFYTALYRHGNLIIGPTDTDASQIAQWLDEEEPLLIAGPDADMLAESLITYRPIIHPVTFNLPAATTSSLLILGEQLYKKGTPSFNIAEGPIYLRKSEAEESLNKINNSDSTEK